MTIKRSLTHSKVKQQQKSHLFFCHDGLFLTLDVKMTAQQVKWLETTHTSKPRAFIDKVDLVHFNDLDSVFWTKRNSERCANRPHTHNLRKHKLTPVKVRLVYLCLWPGPNPPSKYHGWKDLVVNCRGSPRRAKLFRHPPENLHLPGQKMGIWLIVSCLFFSSLQLLLLKLLSPLCFEDVGRRVRSHHPTWKRGHLEGDSSLKTR